MKCKPLFTVEEFYITYFLSENVLFLVVKFSIYLYRRVFEM